MTRIRANSPTPPQLLPSTSKKEDKTPVLHVGSRGKDVRKLETELKERGLLKGKVDNYFGPKTKEAVQRFEQSKGWKDDGRVGNRIRRVLGLPYDKKANAPGGTQPTGGSTSFKTVNINIKNNPVMPQGKVVHDVQKAAKQGDLIGWNEIGPNRYFKAIKDLGPSWGHFFPKDGNLRIPNPISWKKDVWEKQDGGFLRTHNGKAKVSPHRYITWVKLKNKQTGESIVRVNTHLVSGAWSSPKPTTGWRRMMWNVHMNKLSRVVEKFEKKGLPVVIGGDFNRDSYKVLGNQVAYDNNIHQGTHGKSTLDYVMHTKGDGLKSLGAKVQGGYASDHDAVVVKYKLGDKK